MEVSGSTMETKPSQEEVEQLKRKVFRAAQEGRADDLRSALSSVGPDMMKEVLHHRTCRQTDWGYSEETPLSTAAERGRLQVVQLLVDFNIDLDQKVEVQPHYGKGMTALMFASDMGHLNIVKLLVIKGCAVNLANEKNETALYLACWSNRLEVVKYLLENGANVDGDVNRKDGRTCLMVACEEGSDDKVVENLLEKGANINKAFSGPFRSMVTALHLAASKNAVKKVDLLLKNGATMSSNSEGHSPLMEAAWYCCKDVVRFFVKSSYVTREEKIDSLELLGARIVLDNTTSALECLQQAMVMRHEDPLEVIPKPHSSLPAPFNVVESQTLEELEARELDPHQLRLECLATAQRILGPRSSSFLHLCYEHAWDLNMEDHLSEALSLSIHGLQATRGMERIESSDFRFIMRNFAFNLSSMMGNGQVPRFSLLCEILELSLEILEQNKLSQCFSRYSKTFPAMSILCISVCLDVAKGQEEMTMLQKLTKSLIHLQPSYSRGASVLHTAVSADLNKVLEDNLPVEDLHVETIVSFLLQCGADVNSVDNYGNRPLHILARCCKNSFNAETLRNLTHALVEAGAPVSALNREGQTPLDIAVTKEMEEMASVLREFYPVPLQSLAATAVVKHGIPYAGQVPEILEEFLRRH